VGAFAAVKGSFVQKVLAHTDEHQVADPLKIIARLASRSSVST
jgi:hypothetical protein